MFRKLAILVCLFLFLVPEARAEPTVGHGLDLKATINEWFAGHYFYGDEETLIAKDFLRTTVQCLENAGEHMAKKDAFSALDRLEGKLHNWEAYVRVALISWQIESMSTSQPRPLGKHIKKGEYRLLACRTIETSKDDAFGCINKCLGIIFDGGGADASAGPEWSSAESCSHISIFIMRNLW